MNARAWRNLLGALGIWAAHFLALYSIASIWPDTRLAHLLTAVATLVALGALALFARLNRKDRSRSGLAWAGHVGNLALMLATIAVVWQALPALF